MGIGLRMDIGHTSGTGYILTIPSMVYKVYSVHHHMTNNGEEIPIFRFYLGPEICSKVGNFLGEGFILF